MSSLDDDAGDCDVVDDDFNDEADVKFLNFK